MFTSFKWAALYAVVYAAQEGLDTFLIEAEAPGGQAGYSTRIKNDLGFSSGLSRNKFTPGKHPAGELSRWRYMAWADWIASGVGEGAMAVTLVHKYMASL